ncbi:hypothetical protein I302_101766 [Kwoniella bestiolae CBS 10118]|uniref:Uncharacterized protein n=1 Tax=Kwoniella bestiolae CBS 10118 TaxID=1296100 RepID=A0A1B9GD56_9TREE|nr:hypothetical protein I302_00446 [Kwoniella bestiolae CBS 10118]OCF28955.1 hypothetical protein I302_00446 [Kwoniella bestiolae CBS 10118]
MSSLYHQTSHLIQSTYTTLHRTFLTGIQVIRHNSRPFLLLQTGYWSLALIGVALTYKYPRLQQKSLDSANRDLESYKIGRIVVSAYENGRVLEASAWTLGVNLLVGAMGCITLPSMVLPFSGIVMMGIRAISWGMIFSPVAGKPDALTVPHLITMLLEGQGYILAGLGDRILARGIINQLGLWWVGKGEGEVRLDEETQEKKKSWISWPGYREGLKDVLALYGPITAVLAIAALWEAYEVIHLKDGFYGV